MNSSPSQPVIAAQHLKKTYGAHQVHALKDISLDIYPGEFIALMGPSGCGKSTLLNILGTLETPTSGSLLIQGKDIANQDEKSRTNFRKHQLGFIFQFFNLLNTLTVSENVALPLELLSTIPEAKAKQAVSAMLARVGMQHRADFYPAQLSGGEMQRVAIARALIHEPAIILADEPTGNLDSENGLAILKLLKDISEAPNGPVILMATHSEEAARYAHRIIRIRDGLIQNDGLQNSPIQAPVSQG